MLSIELAMIGAAVLLLVLFSTRALAPARCIGCYCALKAHNAYAFCPDCLAWQERMNGHKAHLGRAADEFREWTERLMNGEYDNDREDSVPGDGWAENEIRIKGIRQVIRENHPDRGGSHERMVAINLAYEQMKGARNASSL